MAKKKTDTTSIGFEETIWRAADKLRGNLDAAEYKNVVLGLIFLKFISDRFEAKYDELVNDEYGNPEITTTAFEYRGRFISKYFNRLGAVKQLAYMKRDFFYEVCTSMKEKIISVTKLENLSDERLYNDLSQI